MTREVISIVIDNGTGSLKAGFGGEEAPHSVFQSYVGRPRSSPHGSPSRDVFVGYAAQAKAATLFLTYPIVRGIVTNWDDMEKLWHHAFYNELKVDPSERPVLLADAPVNPKANREKMIQIQFETFDVPSFLVRTSGLLSLYTSGRTTGIVVEVGEGVAQVVPVYEGSEVHHAVMVLDLAGRDITNSLQTVLNENGAKFTTSADFEVVRKIKETVGYVALDFESELQKAAKTKECDASYRLPDGNQIVVSSERFRGPELLFKPLLNGSRLSGIDQTLSDSILKCDGDLRKELYANIVLSGGTTLLPGFPERIEKEITQLTPPRIAIKVVSFRERKYHAWMGGSIVASLSPFPQMLITRREYNDAGPEIVHRKSL